MVSIGPDTQALNFTHMYSFVDLRGPPGPPTVTKGSIYDYISSSPKLRRFKTVVDRAHAIGTLNDIQANCTVLVPTDDSLSHIPIEYFEDMDDGLARQILAASTLDRKLPKNLLTSSPVAYYITRLPSMRMYITNISGVTRLNNCATVKQFDIECNNGLIHLIEGLIAPNEDHFMN